MRIYGDVTLERDVSAENERFWNELCGSHLARSLGVTDNSRESLKRFDDWFLDFYPYLSRHIPFQAFKGGKVLEVGLGYGTVAQKIAETGTDYTGLDIATGPVAMVNHRLMQNNLEGRAIVGSILDAPFHNETFDFVVAIGCYHHTGDMQRALDETYRILKTGGTAVIMVYNALSYRRWMTSFSETFQYFLAASRGDYRLFNAEAAERKLYDAGSDGTAAPHTDFFSASHIKSMTSEWQSVDVFSENVGMSRWYPDLMRAAGLPTLGRVLGLDIYCRLRK